MSGGAHRAWAVSRSFPTAVSTASGSKGLSQPAYAGTPASARISPCAAARVQRRGRPPVHARGPNRAPVAYV